MLQTIFAVLSIQVNNDFAIALSQELMTAALEALAQLAIIVNFTVGNQPQNLSYVMQGLMPGSKVNDGQPSMTQRRHRIGILTFVVRSAMGKRIQHAFQRLGFALNQSGNSCDTAHELGGSRRATMDHR